MSEANGTPDPREAFFADDGPQFAHVLCPEPIGKVRAYCMTAGERETFDLLGAKRRRKNRPVNFRARLLIKSIRRDDGSSLFQNADESKLAAMPTKKTDLMFAAACNINGYTDEEAEDEEGN